MGYYYPANVQEALEIPNGFQYGNTNALGVQVKSNSNGRQLEMHLKGTCFQRTEKWTIVAEGGNDDLF